MKGKLGLFQGDSFRVFVAFGFQGVYYLLLQSTGFVFSDILDFLNKLYCRQIEASYFLNCELNFKNTICL